MANTTNPGLGNSNSDREELLSTVVKKFPCKKNKNMYVYTLFIRNLAKGLVLNVPYFPTSFYQILVLKVP